MKRLLLPLFAILLIFSACSGDLPLPEESVPQNNSSRPEVNTDNSKDQSTDTSATPEETLIDPVVSPDEKYTFTVTKNEIFVTDEENSKTVLEKDLIPENATVTAAVWRQGKVYITFTSEKDTLVCWDMESAPVKIKEGIKNTYSPLSVTDYDVLEAGDLLIIPFHDGSMDSLVARKDLVLGYVVYYDKMSETDHVLTLDEGRETISVTALADCKVTLLDCDTEKAVSDKVALKAGERLFITCAIPEGFPAYKIRLDLGEETSTFTVAYDGRGETNVWFLTADTYK
ncbi:MAG: hypothetical protein IKM27_02320 [Clostridia bacterium]|nr:hypothetical protein [Clostridia bacterium]